MPHWVGFVPTCCAVLAAASVELGYAASGPFGGVTVGMDSK